LFRLIWFLIARSQQTHYSISKFLQTLMNFFPTISPKTLLLCLTIAFLVPLFSCSDETTIKKSIIDSEYTGPVVTWVLPESWGENPALGGPMAGSFHVITQEGPQGRIGVMPFRETVSSLEVANMFAREIGYGLLDEVNLAPLLEKKTIGTREFEWIRLEEQRKSQSQKTVLLALYRKDSQTWLFPFIGEKALIDEELENFSRFLESTVLRAGSEPIKALSRSVSSSPPPVQPPPGPPPPDWNIPSNWTPGKQSTMRLASYIVNDELGNKLDFSVTSFPGDVGGLLANVNRWLGQIDVSATDEEGLKEFVRSITIDNMKAQLVEASSTEKSLYAAILMRENRSWFFKLNGSKALAEKEKVNFLAFLESIRFPKL
jgi:hypothetical protein